MREKSDLRSPFPLPAGRHVLLLRNPDLGLERRYSVDVPEGGEVVLKADLLK